VRGGKLGGLAKKTKKSKKQGKKRSGEDRGAGGSAKNKRKTGKERRGGAIPTNGDREKDFTWNCDFAQVGKGLRFLRSLLWGKERHLTPEHGFSRNPGVILTRSYAVKKTFKDLVREGTSYVEWVSGEKRG